MNAAAKQRSVLQDGVVYLGDNGQAICSCCAGYSAKFSGRDISGQAVLKVTANDLLEVGAESMSCECGKTMVMAA